MKKYTKAKRREIYLRAAELIASRGYSLFNEANKYACGALTYATLDTHGEDWDLVVVDFPEFMMFRPEEDFNTEYIGIWWADNGEYNTQEARRIALLLCAEMCK
jgi:hypothetical protein